MSLNRFDRVIGRATDEAAALRHARSLLAIAEDVRTAIPGGFWNRIRVANLKGGALTLIAENGAIANKARHFETPLRASLVSKGWEVSQIRWRVQADNSGVTPAQCTPRHELSDPAKAGLAGLACSIGADSPLSIAIHRLLDRG